MLELALADSDVPGFYKVTLTAAEFSTMIEEEREDGALIQVCRLSRKVPHNLHAGLWGQ